MLTAVVFVAAAYADIVTPMPKLPVRPSCLQEPQTFCVHGGVRCATGDAACSAPYVRDGWRKDCNDGQHEIWCAKEADTLCATTTVAPMLGAILLSLALTRRRSDSASQAIR